MFISTPRYLPFLCAVLAAVLFAVPASRAQNLYVANSNGTMVEYAATTGTALNGSFVTGLGGPYGVALSGNNLYVANSSNGTVGEYNATTGATINAALISGLTVPTGIAISGSNLYVTSLSSNTVGRYNAVTGATINASFITGLGGPAGLAISGTNLYVANFGGATVGEYDAGTGATENAALIGGLNLPWSIAISGSNFYVLSRGNATVGEYDMTTGAIFNASLIVESGTYNPMGIALSGSDLFIANNGNGSVSEYDAAAGGLIDPTLVAGAALPLSIAISPPAPVISSTLSASATNGMAFSYQIVASNDPLSFTAGNLPTGLGYNASTGLISGTPTVSGTFSASISAINVGGTDSETLSLTVITPPGPVISSVLSATGTLDFPFYYQITATNNPTVFGAGSLPAGLGYNASSGVISGTPATTGTFTAKISAISVGGTAQANLSLVLVREPTPVLSSALSGTGTGDFPFTYQISASNAPTSFKATGLPSGLAVNSSTGLISGTPAATGTFSVAIGATNIGGTVSGTLSLVLAAPPAPVISSALTETGTADFPFNYQITASNNATSFAATGLPPGVSVSSTSGLISGVPSATGTFAITISAINLGGTGSDVLTLVALTPPPPVISGTLSATGISTYAFDYQITASNNPTIFGASGLPAGLSVDASSGMITGEPSVTGTFTAIVSATNAGGSDAELLSLDIIPPLPVITSAVAAWGVTGVPFSYQIVASNDPVSFDASGLPAGLSVNPSTGLISGTAGAAGRFATTISATNGNGPVSETLYLTVTANFAKLKGTYVGLGVLDGTNAGLFTLSLTPKGAFTGKLTVAGAKYPLKGTFSSYGTSSGVRSTGPNTLDVELSIDPSLPAISGTVTATSASAINQYSVQGGLLGRFNASSLPKGLGGSYTAILPALTGTDPTLPHVHGYGTMSVATSGAVRIVGKLGDGTAFTSRSQLHADGKTFTLFDLPNMESVAGNILFETGSTSDCDGVLGWIKPKGIGGEFYPGGFSATVELLGAKYVAPPIASGTASITLSGGGMPAFSDALAVSATGKVTVTGSNGGGVVLLLNPHTGGFSGHFLNPSTEKKTLFSGAIYQKPTPAGFGLFPGTDEAGSVDISR